MVAAFDISGEGHKLISVSNKKFKFFSSPADKDSEYYNKPKTLAEQSI
jgi:hypothetical protein